MGCQSTKVADGCLHPSRVVGSVIKHPNLSVGNHLERTKINSGNTVQASRSPSDTKQNMLEDQKPSEICSSVQLQAQHEVFSVDSMRVLRSKLSMSQSRIGELRKKLAHRPKALSSLHHLSMPLRSPEDGLSGEIITEPVLRRRRSSQSCSPKRQSLCGEDNLAAKLANKFTCYQVSSNLEEVKSSLRVSHRSKTQAKHQTLFQEGALQRNNLLPALPNLSQANPQEQAQKAEPKHRVSKKTSAIRTVLLLGTERLPNLSTQKIQSRGFLIRPLAPKAVGKNFRVIDGPSLFQRSNSIDVGKKLKMHKRAATCGQSLKDLFAARRAAAHDEDAGECLVQPSQQLDMVLELSTETMKLPVKQVRSSGVKEQRLGSLHRGISRPNQQ